MAEKLTRGAKPRQAGGLSEERIADLDRARMLEKAVETMRLGLTVTDPFGTIVYVNPADAALHGYEQQELLGQHSSLYSAQGPSLPTPRRRTWPWARARLNRTRDGRQFPVRLISDAVFDDEGHLQAIVTVCEDISSRLQIQETLLRRDRVLEAVSFAAERLLETDRWEHAVPVMLDRLSEATGADRVYLLALSPSCDAVERIWAVPQGLRVRRLSAALGRPEQVRSLCALLSHHGPRVQACNGETAVAGPLPAGPARSLLLCPIHTDHPRAILALESDDPESPWAEPEVQALGIAGRLLAAAIGRCQATEALTRSEANYRNLIESAADLIQAMDSDGRLRFANRAWRDRLGYVPGEIHELTLGGVAAPECQTTFHDALSEAMRCGFAHTEGLLLTRNGDKVPVEGRWSLLDGEGPAAVVAVFRDLTEEHHLDRLKRAFIATASHELRTPLSSMIASLELLRQARDGSADSPGEDLLEIADRNAQRLLTLTTDLLDLHKLSAGVLRVEPGPVAIEGLLQEVLHQALPAAEARHVRLRARCSRPDLIAWADPHRLLQVLSILVSNAIQHGPDGQAVTMAAARKGARLTVRVRDRGNGIPETIQTRLFEEFVQADSATPHTLGGRGLGLALAHGLMRSMGGSLILRPGRGLGTLAELVLVPAGHARTTASSVPAPTARS
jgi:PAS domain S-box-containing protein